MTEQEKRIGRKIDVVLLLLLKMSAGVCFAATCLIVDGTHIDKLPGYMKVVFGIAGFIGMLILNVRSIKTDDDVYK